MRFKDKVAFIAGAGASSPGWSNGKAVSVLLAREGARVFALDQSAAHLEETLQAIRAEGGTCVGHTADVTREAEVAAAVARCVAEFGRIDVLFNNVGLQAIGGPVEVDEATWDRLMAANIKSMYLACRHVLPVMARQKSGVIVNVTSVVGSSGNAGQANYAAAKAGVAGMSRALARELGSRNIPVNCVAPGFIDTDMTRSLSEAQSAALMQQIPLARFGQPEDVAHAVAYLASPQAGYVTGTTLHVNGGMYME